MEPDLTSFIASQRQSLSRQREELEKKLSPRYTEPLSSALQQENKMFYNKREEEINKLLDHNDGLSLDIGGHESKREKLRRERQEEYKTYMKQKTFRTFGEVSQASNVNRNDEFSRDQRADTKKDYKSEIDKEYEAMLNKKKNEEKVHRVQFNDDQTDGRKNTSKKTIEFNSDEEELFEFVKKEKKKKRRQSADSNNRRPAVEEFKNAVVFEGRAKSVPGIFGGGSNTNIAIEKKQKYKSDLEQQMKEKEAIKEKEKLKKLGRITSAEFNKGMQNNWFESPPQRDTPSPRQRKTPTPRSKPIQEANVTNPNGQQVTPPGIVNPYQMYMNQGYPQVVNPQLMSPVMNPAMYGWPPGYNMMQPPMMNYQTNTPQQQQQQQQQQGYYADTSPQTNRRQREDTQQRKQWSKPTQENDKPKVPPLQLDKSQNGKESFHSRTALQPPGGKTHMLFKTSLELEDESILKKKEHQKTYQEELKRQIELKKSKEAKEKAAHEKYEEKLEREIATYDPWGKGGGGAPVRNTQGGVVANLRLLRNDSESAKEKENHSIPNKAQELSPLMKALENASLPSNIEDLSPLLRALEQSMNGGTTAKGLGQSMNTGATEKHFEQSINGGAGSSTEKNQKYTRGAALKELQGATKSPRDKNDQEDYKKFLQAQVEEKKKKQEEIKEKARLEEEKENLRLLEQQKKIQEEFEQEQLKQKRKDEELRRQNEELRLAAEKKRFEEDRKQREIKEEQDLDLRKEAERKLSGNSDLPPSCERTSSPPVPAIIKERRKSKDKYKETKDSKNDETSIPPKQRKERRSSKQRQVVDKKNDIEDIKKIRESLEKQDKTTKTNIQQQDYIIQQLSALRRQLQKQEVNIQAELNENKMKYKEMSVKPKANRAKVQGKEIFERAARKASAKQTNINEGGDDSSSTTYEYSSDQRDLDMQQQDYMRQQEIRLKALRENIEQQSDTIKTDQPSVSIDDDRTVTDSTDSSNGVPGRILNDRYNKTSSSSSARARRREKQNPNTFSGVFENYLGANEDTASINTLQIEDMAKKNNERLKKFQINTNEDDKGGEADDIVKQFMSENRRLKSTAKQS